MYEPTDGAPLKRTIVATAQPKAELILPLGDFTIMCEIWDKFGTYAEVVVDTIQVMKNDNFIYIG